MPQRVRVRLGLTGASDQTVLATAGAVITGMTGNKSFPNAPVDAPTLQSALTAFTDAIAARPHGGVKATADKKNKREALIDLLQKLAMHVQTHCDNDPALVLSAGFSLSSGSRAQSPVPKPSILSIDNGNSTQLVVKVGRIANARCYQLEIASFAPGGVQSPWEKAGTFTSARSMTVTGLTPGTTYTVRASAFGGSTGWSDWSDPVSHMCM